MLLDLATAVSQRAFGTQEPFELLWDLAAARKAVG